MIKLTLHLTQYFF